MDSTADIIAAFRASKEASFTEFLKKLDMKKEAAYNKLESECDGTLKESDIVRYPANKKGD